MKRMSRTSLIGRRLRQDWRPLLFLQGLRRAWMRHLCWAGPPESDGQRRLLARGGVRETVHLKERGRPIERVRQRELDRRARALHALTESARTNSLTTAAIKAARRGKTTRVDIEDL